MLIFVQFMPQDNIFPNFTAILLNETAELVVKSKEPENSVLNIPFVKP